VNNSTQTTLLKHHTTFQLGGVAAMFVSVASVEELREALQEATTKNLPVTILGGGSNILAHDCGVSGMVIKMAIVGRQYEVDGESVLCTYGAGEVFDDVVFDTVERGWWGLENLSAIPGTVGATPVQNVGAYGVEIADVLVSLRAVHLTTGEERVFTAKECSFSYRDSFFKSEEGRQWCVVSLTLRVSTKPFPKIDYKDLAVRFSLPPTSAKAVREAVVQIRHKKFPDWQTVGTAGSFFKNPIIPKEQYESLRERFPELPGFMLEQGTVKVPLGYVLDKLLHLRGVYKGNVGCFEGQALVLVTKPEATTAEVVTFATFIADEVKKLTQIDIEWEVTRVGF
jgi:UDP-N-acetylmuramate dehydrogenase